MNITIRPATPKDIVAINNLGNCSYPVIYKESDASFSSKLTAGWTWVAEADAYVVGYLVAVPYELGRTCALNTTYAPVEHANCLYFHDVCVMEIFRHLGVGTELVAHALTTPWQNFSLVAVLGAEKFWQRFGFCVVREFNYFGGRGVYMELKR